VELFAQLLVNGLGNGSFYALLGLGFGLIFATTRIVHFAYGPIYAVSAYAAWFASAVVGMPLVLAALLAPIVGGAVGAVVYWLAYRPFERRGMASHSVLILSLGLSIILECLITLAFGPSIHTMPDFSPAVFIIGPVFLTSLQIGENLALIVVALATLLFLRRTRYGVAILAFVGLRERAFDLAEDLSYAEEKLLVVARLIATEAEVLLFDEPLSGLDHTAMQTIIDLLRQLARGNKAICIIEHNLEAIRSACDRLIYLDEGRALAEGEPEALMRDPDLVRRYFQ
jgi:branched-chain amino acid transport system permease protein